MRVMAIDIGTNSTLHLIAEVQTGEVSVLQRGIESNGLGRYAQKDGSLSADLIESNRLILERLAGKAVEFECSKCLAVGTHALRNAVNRDEFITMSERIGMPIRIISPEAESHYAWQGVFGRSGPSVNSALLDIGGGSSELSVGDNALPGKSISLPVGAVNLCRRFFLNDPPDSTEISAARQYVKDVFTSWSDLLPPNTELVGTAGTITSLTAVHNKLAEFVPGMFESLTLSADQIDFWFDNLIKLDEDSRRLIPCMPPARAGSIHSGVLILKEILSILERKSLRVSERGVLFGVALELGASDRKA